MLHKFPKKCSNVHNNNIILDNNTEMLTILHFSTNSHITGNNNNNNNNNNNSNHNDNKNNNI